MNEYHKIKTVFKRDPNNNYKTLIYGDYALPEFEYLKDNKWMFTEKVDGTNIRVMFNRLGMKFGGKTDRAEIPPFLLEKLQGKFLNQFDKFKEIFDCATDNEDVCLYGEGYGAKIQKGGGNYREDQDFVLFDVKIGKWWLKRKDVEDIATQLEIDTVPIRGFGSLKDMVEKVQCGFNSVWGDFRAEGIVARPEIELKTRSGERIITKIKHKDF